jgi:hypothetical protein
VVAMSAILAEYAGEGMRFSRINKTLCRSNLCKDPDDMDPHL